MFKRLHLKMRSVCGFLLIPLSLVVISLTMSSCNDLEIRTFTFGPYAGITNPINPTHRPNGGQGTMTIDTEPYELPFTLPLPHIVIPVILPNDGTIKALRIRLQALGGSGSGNLVTATLYRKVWDGGLTSDSGQVVARAHVTESQRNIEHTINVTGLNERIVDDNFYFLEVYGDKSLCGYFLLGGFQVDVEMKGIARYWRG
jgi:hypothetical protein